MGIKIQSSKNTDSHCMITFSSRQPGGVVGADVKPWPVYIYVTKKNTFSRMYIHIHIWGIAQTSRKTSRL